MTGFDDTHHVHLRPGVPADLAPCVLRWEGFRDLHARPFTHLMPADTFVPLILNFGDPYHIHAGHRPTDTGLHDTFVAGLTDRFTVVRSAGSIYCMQVDFTPLGARAFLHLPLNEIAGQVVSLQDLLGRAGRDLAERLAACGSWPDRFALLEHFIRHRVAEGPAPSALVGQAMRRIMTSSGRVRVGVLADSLDISREHLARRFAADVGISPKAFARIIRFRHAEESLRQGRAAAVEIAIDAGYADQAHMSREVRRMSGLPPGDL